MGPPAGGTKVTVTGENLGVGESNTFISIGQQECIINHVDPFIRYVSYLGLHLLLPNLS